MDKQVLIAAGVIALAGFAIWLASDRAGPAGAGSAAACVWSATRRRLPSSTAALSSASHTGLPFRARVWITALESVWARTPRGLWEPLWYPSRIAPSNDASMPSIMPS